MCVASRPVSQYSTFHVDYHPWIHVRIYSGLFLCTFSQQCTNAVNALECWLLKSCFDSSALLSFGHGKC